MRFPEHIHPIFIIGAILLGYALGFSPEFGVIWPEGGQLVLYLYATYAAVRLSLLWLFESMEESMFSRLTFSAFLISVAIIIFLVVVRWELFENLFGSKYGHALSPDDIFADKGNYDHFSFCDFTSNTNIAQLYISSVYSKLASLGTREV